MKELEEKAKIHRKQVINLAMKTGHSHIAGSFSIVEILISLYHQIMEKEDKFILSKGHSCLGFYLLLQEKGFLPEMSGHPDIDEKNGIYCTTGSLGHGLPIGVGMALARKILNKKGHIYVLMGDGECQEGTTWEALILARRFKLDNLTIIVDHNKLQALSKIDNFIDLKGGLRGIFAGFGLDPIEINGHDFNELLMVLNKKSIIPTKPRLIVAHTIKGKGVSFMENNPKWHTCLFNEEELKQAYKELE